MDHHQVYKYFQYTRSQSSPDENARARSAIAGFKPRICCECGVEECPYCGRSPSPPSKKESFYPEFMEKEYKNLAKSTTHENFRSYGNKKDLEILFGFPAGRANPDEVYFDRSPNNKRSKDRRTYSNIERYKEASPIMKRGLQSHISDILGYEISTESVEEDSPRKGKDIFAQGLPPGIYRRFSPKSTVSLSPVPQGKKQAPWQRLSKRDLEQARTQKLKKKKKQNSRGSSPQKIRDLVIKSLKGARDLRETRETRGSEVQQQEGKWKNADLTQAALSKFQDKVKQASMLLKKSHSDAPINREGNQEYSTACKSMNDFSYQTYVDNDYTSFNKRDERTALIERIAAKEKEKEQKSLKIPTRIQKGQETKASNEIETKASEELEENPPMQGDSLMYDIFRRYGNQNRGASVKDRQVKERSNGSSRRGSSLLNETVPNQNQANLNISSTDFKNTFGNEKMTKSELLSQQIDKIIKKDSFNVNSDEAGAPKSKSAILSQQVSLLREMSQALLKRGGSAEEFQSQGTNSSAEQPHGTFQREQGYFEETGKTFKSSEIHSYPSQQSNSEEDDQIEQRASSKKGGSKKSLGKESSVVEFIPADELSLRNVNPFMYSKVASQQEENQEYPSSSHRPSAQRSIERLRSQEVVASRSSIADSQLGKRNSGMGTLDNLSQNSESKVPLQAEPQIKDQTKAAQVQKKASWDEGPKNLGRLPSQNEPEANQMETSVLINKALRSSDFRRQLSQEIPFEGNPILGKPNSEKGVSQVLSDKPDSAKDFMPGQRPPRKDNTSSDREATNLQEKQISQASGEKGSRVEGNFYDDSQIRREIAFKNSRNTLSAQSPPNRFSPAESEQQESNSINEGSFIQNQGGNKTNPPLYQSLHQGNPKRTDIFAQIKKSSSLDETGIQRATSGEIYKSEDGSLYEKSQIRKEIASKISRNASSVQGPSNRSSPAEDDQQESSPITQGSFSNNQDGKKTSPPFYQPPQQGNPKKTEVSEESYFKKSSSFEKTVIPKASFYERDRSEGSPSENSQARKQIASKNTLPVQGSSNRSSPVEYDQQEQNSMIQGSFSKKQDGKKTTPPPYQQDDLTGVSEEPCFKKTSSFDKTGIPKASSGEQDRIEGSPSENSRTRNQIVSKKTSPVQNSSNRYSSADYDQQESNSIEGFLSKNQDRKKTTPPLHQSLQQGNPKKPEVSEEEPYFRKASSLDETINPKHGDSQTTKQVTSKKTLPVRSSSNTSSLVEYDRQESSPTIRDFFSNNQDGKKTIPLLHQSSYQQGNQNRTNVSQESHIKKSPSLDETAPKPSSVGKDNPVEESSPHESSQIRKEIASKISRNASLVEGPSNRSSPAEYDQQESNSMSQGSFLNNQERKKAISYPSQNNQKKSDVFEEPQIKKSSSIDQTSISKSSQSGFTKNQSGSKSIPVQENTQKGSSSFIKQVSLVESQRIPSQKGSIESIPNSSDEPKELKPKRINSWTDRSKDSRNSIPTEPNQTIEDVKAPELSVSTTGKQKPLVPTPPTGKQKPQEIEDLLEVHKYVHDKDNDDKVKLLWDQEAVDESHHSSEKSGSYEFSFEENSPHTGDQRRPNEDPKPGKVLPKTIVKNEQKLVQQITDDSSSPIENARKEQKLPQQSAEGRFRIDERQPHYIQDSSKGQTQMVYEDMKVDTERDIKGKINILKPKGQMVIDQPNQSGTEFNNKLSFSPETRGAIATREEPKKNYLVEYFDVKVVYKDDQRQLMLQNFMSGKPVVTTQAPQGNLARKDLFRYAK